MFITLKLNFDKMGTMTAVFLDYNTIGPDDLDPSPLIDCLPDIEFYGSTTPDEVKDRIQNAEFILTNKVQLNSSNLEGAKKLKFIGLTATGADNIDLGYAKKKNIRVCNIRAYCTQSVVEHVFGALLSLTHNLRSYSQLVDGGDWQKSDDFCLLRYPIKELSSMKLGVVGYGELGRNVAKMGKAFGMSVIINTRSKNEFNCEEEHVTFKRLLEESDVVSLHCPLTIETKNLIGIEEVKLMKPSSILINTARGGLIDSEALLFALKNGIIAGAAIDVLPEEPPINGNALLEYKKLNLIMTPHIAWGAIEARQNAISQLAGTIKAFQNNQKINALV